MKNESMCQVCRNGRPEIFRRPWLSRCGQCGVLSADFPVAIPSTKDDGGVDEALRHTGLEQLRAINNRRILATIDKLARHGARILDVGCGPGFFLTEALAEGYAVEGVEPDANVVSEAAKTGAPVRHGYFPDALDQAETYDVILFNDVLEHIPDLRGALAAAYRHLAPGGVLCLNCPDKRGFYYRTAALLDRLGVSGPYDRLWQRGLPSPHVWYFTPALLRRAATNAGLNHAEDARLATLELRGLWSRIAYVKDTPLPLALASFAFAVTTYPLTAILPSDATACFFRKPKD